jgi:hypothetical protein
MAKSRWEIENRGFNEGENRYGMEHLCHHEPNSILIVWLLILLALVIERLYRLRHLRGGDHGVRSAQQLCDYLWLTLGLRSSPTLAEPAPSGWLAAFRCSLTTRRFLWSEPTPRGPPSPNGHQECCLPCYSDPPHHANSCSAELPKRLGARQPV